MSGFVPRPAQGQHPEEDHPSLLQRTLSREERHRRWEVRAAQWRARELESRFLASVYSDPLLSRVPLVFVVGPVAA